MIKACRGEPEFYSTIVASVVHLEINCYLPDDAPVTRQSASVRRWVWHTHIEANKEALALAMNKYFQFSNNIVLLVPLNYQKIKLL